MNRLLRHSRPNAARWVRSQNNDLLARKEMEGLSKEIRQEGQAGKQVYVFPEEYEPHTFNYHSNGLFLGVFSMMSFAYLSYEQDWLNQTGQVNRQAGRVYHYV